MYGEPKGAISLQHLMSHLTVAVIGWIWLQQELIKLVLWQRVGRCYLEPNH
jgi:hypothetical protein